MARRYNGKLSEETIIVSDCMAERMEQRSRGQDDLVEEVPEGHETVGRPATLSERSCRDGEDLPASSVSILQALADPDVPLASVMEKYDLPRMFTARYSLMEQTLLACAGSLDPEHDDLFQTKFVPLLRLILKLLPDSTRRSGGGPCNQVMRQLVDQGDAQRLSKVLELVYSRNDDRFGERCQDDGEGCPEWSQRLEAPNDNCLVLLKACNKDNFQIVRLFVNAGYRLRTAKNTADMRGSNKKRTSSSSTRTHWWWPRVIGWAPCQNEEPVDEEGHAGKATDVAAACNYILEVDDELNDLNILRMMAKPAYIISCYLAAVEAQNQGRCRGQHDPGSDGESKRSNLSQCHYQGQQQRGRDICNGASYLNSRTRDKISGGEQGGQGRLHLADVPRPHVLALWQPDLSHFCPGHENYQPDSSCRGHAECNDPIFRCFDLAVLARKMSKKVQDYQTEYEEIERCCTELSVELLDQCTNTCEVQTLLSERTASSKYFRFAWVIKYPRLRLAVENNHKEFAGHMYCQQVLRQQWHGCTHWEDMGYLSQLTYMVVFLLTTPIHVATYSMVNLGRNFLQARRIFSLPAKIAAVAAFSKAPPSSKAAPSRNPQGFAATWRRWLTSWSELKVSLDVPLNRFILHMAWYFCFATLVVYSAMLPSVTWDSETTTPVVRMRWNDYGLLIYSAGMLWQNLMLISNLKFKKSYFKHWRVYDLTLLGILSLGLLTRLAASTIDTTHSCSEVWRALSIVSGITYGIASTLVIFRLLYFLQLHGKAGPTIINMSRVISDITVVMFTFIVTLVAFATGMTFLISAQDLGQVGGDANSSNGCPIRVKRGHGPDPSNMVDVFINSTDILFWALLAPEKPQTLPNEGAVGTMVSSIFIVYQMTVTIILLNLLIAVINNKVQKVYEKRQLYWKFARASLWIEYFDEHNALAPPFNLFQISTAITIRLTMALKYLLDICTPLVGVRSSLTQTPSSEKCLEIQGTEKERHAHTHLMKELIHRYCEKNGLEIKGDLKTEPRISAKRPSTFSNKERFSRDYQSF